MLRKLKFFTIGLIPGLLFVFFILNQKGTSCSGYLPNSRVIAETLSKEASYTAEIMQQMAAAKVDETFLRDSILTNGNIDFDRSHAQKKPCPDYTLYYPKNRPKYELQFEKCQEGVKFYSLKTLR